MGGYGSTRWGTYRRKARVTESLRLDIAELLELPAHTQATIEWKSGDSIRIRKTATDFSVHYQVK